MVAIGVLCQDNFDDTIIGTLWICFEILVLHLSYAGKLPFTRNKDICYTVQNTAEETDIVSKPPEYDGLVVVKSWEETEYFSAYTVVQKMDLLIQ